MATIVAIEKDGVIYAGFDAVKQRCDVKYYVTSEENLNLHKMKSGVLVYSVGIAAFAQQMWLHDEWFDLEEDEEFDKEFIVTKIIPKFYEATKDFNKWEEDRGVSRVDTGFLMIYKDSMYYIFNDLCVMKCKGIACMSNEDEDMQVFAYAKAYMEKHPDASPEDVIKETFKFAAPLNRSVNLHGYLINTKDLEFKEMGIK